jgi:hypothetical protein
MDDSSGVPKVKFRRNFNNLPKQEKGKGKKQKREEEEENLPESPKKGPPPPDKSSTLIDITA